MWRRQKIPIVGKDVNESELPCMAVRCVLPVIPGSNNTLVTGCYNLPFGPVRRTPASALGLSDMKCSTLGRIFKVKPEFMGYGTTQSPEYLCVPTSKMSALSMCLLLISCHAPGRTSVDKRWTLLFSRSTQDSTDELPPPTDLW